MTWSLSLLVVALLVLAALWATKRKRSAKLLDWLLSSDPKVWRRGKAAIWNARFDPTDLPRVYEVLRRAHPDDLQTPPAGLSARTLLFSKLGWTHDAGTVEFIRTAFPSLPPNPLTQSAALGVLTAINTRRSLETLLSLLEKHPLELSPTDAHGLFRMQTSQPMGRQQAALLFPRLFPLLSHPGLRQSIYRLLVHACANQALPSAVLEQCRPQLIDDFKAETRLRFAQSEESEDYYNSGETLHAIINAMAFLDPDQEVVALLSRLVSERTHRPRLVTYRTDLRLTGAAALLRMGVQPDPSVLEQLAADPNTRLALCEELQSLDETDLLPQAYRSQQGLAEADLVRWLSFKSEAGQPPLSIELLETRVLHNAADAARYYIFKFRYPDGDAVDMPPGWRFGVSGPWAVNAADLTVVKDRNTYSTFTPVEEMDLDDYFKDFGQPPNTCYLPRTPDVPYRHDE